MQQMVAGNPNWWNMNNARPPPRHQQQPSPPFLLPPNSSLFPSNMLTSWHDNQEIPAESWSQLLMGEEDKCNMSQFQAKKLETWESQVMNNHPSNASLGDVKQEGAVGAYVYGHGVNEELHAPNSTWSNMVPPASSPKSCVTSFNSNILDFSNKNKADRSSECNSTATGGALKKARVQTSTQSTFKVRKEKLGDRITALHQLVSPFGKTDTASVLLEAIGYIRFLQSQIEALSLPYLDSGSGSVSQQSVQGERNCIFPEDPGQLLDAHCMRRKGTSEQDTQEEPKKDLRSRGLCLVPVSCTLQVGSDNGADYWAPALTGSFR